MERSIRRTIERIARRQDSRSPTSSRTSRCPRSPKKTHLRSPTYSRSSRRSRSRSPKRDYCSPRKSCSRSKSPPRSQQEFQSPPKQRKWWWHGASQDQRSPSPARFADPQRVWLTPVGESRALKWNFNKTKTWKEPFKSKSRQPFVDPDSQPSVDNKTSRKPKAALKQPTAGVREKEFIYRSPERPNFIPETIVLRALPFTINNPEI